MNGKFSIAMVLGVVLGACATSGNDKLKDQNQTTISTQIVEGRTSKREVTEFLGPATTVSFTDAGNEIWTYRHARATPQARNFIPIANLFSRGADVTTKELVIMFNREGTVSRYTMREVQNAVQSGLVH